MSLRHPQNATNASLSSTDNKLKSRVRHALSQLPVLPVQFLHLAVQDHHVAATLQVYTSITNKVSSLTITGPLHPE